MVSPRHFYAQNSLKNRFMSKEKKKEEKPRVTLLKKIKIDLETSFTPPATTKLLSRASQNIIP